MQTLGTTGMPFWDLQTQRLSGPSKGSQLSQATQRRQDGRPRVQCGTIELHFLTREDLVDIDAI